MLASNDNESVVLRNPRLQSLSTLTLSIARQTLELCPISVVNTNFLPASNILEKPVATASSDQHHLAIHPYLYSARRLFLSVVHTAIV